MAGGLGERAGRGIGRRCRAGRGGDDRLWTRRHRRLGAARQPHPPAARRTRPATHAGRHGAGRHPPGTARMGDPSRRAVGRVRPAGRPAHLPRRTATPGRTRSPPGGVADGTPQPAPRLPRRGAARCLRRRTLPRRARLRQVVPTPGTPGADPSAGQDPARGPGLSLSLIHIWTSSGPTSVWSSRSTAGTTRWRSTRWPTPCGRTR